MAITAMNIIRVGKSANLVRIFVDLSASRASGLNFGRETDVDGHFMPVLR